MKLAPSPATVYQKNLMIDRKKSQGPPAVVILTFKNLMRKKAFKLLRQTEHGL